MSDLLVPQKGVHPWLPADNATPVEVLNEYNVPLTGLVEQGGATYLYACLFGELEQLNTWAYACLTEQELEDLHSSFDEDLTDAVQKALTNRMLVVALASDYKLLDWGHVDAGTEVPVVVARRFVEKLRQRLDSVRSYVGELEEQPELTGC